jgi:hypothetical protein
MDYTTAGLERLGASLCLSDPRMFNKHTTLEFDIHYSYSYHLFLYVVSGENKARGEKIKKEKQDTFPAVNQKLGLIS